MTLLVDPHDLKGSCTTYGQAFTPDKACVHLVIRQKCECYPGWAYFISLLFAVCITKIEQRPSTGRTLTAARSSTALPPRSTIFSLGHPAREAGNPDSWLWPRRSSASCGQPSREVARSLSWLWAMESLARREHPARLLPRVEMRFDFSTRVFSALRPPRSAGHISLEAHHCRKDDVSLDELRADERLLPFPA